ncbi:hypothetical protein Tco_0445025 [Tanacetum coccineum]
MSSTTSVVTYTSVYTDSEPSRAFWGADDEEISEGEPLSLEYIPLVGMSYEFPAVSEAAHYIPVEFSHCLSHPDMLLSQIPRRIQRSTRMMRQRMVQLTILWTGEMMEMMMMVIHLGMTLMRMRMMRMRMIRTRRERGALSSRLMDSFVYGCTVDELVFPPGGKNEPCYPPPSTRHTLGARITSSASDFLSLPPDGKRLKRLLAQDYPSPSPPISLSPPFAGERLARCTSPPAHSSPLLPSSGCPTQIQTLRITSTQALINAVTVALPSPPLSPLPPSLYIPSPVDHRDDIPESEQPPHKRLCLSTLGSRYEIKESSTARPTKGRGIDYGFVSTVDTEDRVTELAELHEHDTQDLYASLEDAQYRDSMDGRGGGLCFPRGLGSLVRIESGDPSGASDLPRLCVCTRDPSSGTSDTATAAGRQAQMIETLRVMRDMRREMSDMQTELLALRG